MKFHIARPSMNCPESPVPAVPTIWSPGCKGVDLSQRGLLFNMDTLGNCDVKKKKYFRVTKFTASTVGPKKGVGNTQTNTKYQSNF